MTVRADNTAGNGQTVTITATRHKNEKWRVHIVYPDGSYATHRGVVDWGYAGSIAERAIEKAEDMLAEPTP